MDKEPTVLDMPALHLKLYQLGACPASLRWLSLQETHNPIELWSMVGNTNWLCFLLQRYKHTTPDMVRALALRMEVLVKDYAESEDANLVGSDFDATAIVQSLQYPSTMLSLCSTILNDIWMEGPSDKQVRDAIRDVFPTPPSLDPGDYSGYM